MTKISTRRLAFCALFAALLAVFSQIAIPLQMVPINLALLAVYLSAFLLPKFDGLWAVIAYLLIGLVGAPVFSGFRGGAAALFGKTGGYLLGYALCALVIVLIKKRGPMTLLKRIMAMLLGLALCYGFGTLWFMHVSGNSLMTSLGYCVFPFLPGDAVKIALAVLLAPRLEKALQNLR